VAKTSRHYAYPNISADNSVRNKRDPRDKGVGQLEPARGKFAKFLVQLVKEHQQGRISADLTNKKLQCGRNARAAIVASIAT
jgi:hypothetical protein